MKGAATLEQACIMITDGTHYTPKDAGSGIPFLTVKDVTDSALDFSTCSFISNEDFRAAKAGNSAPQRGDVLFSKDGTVGKVHVVSSDEPFAVLSSLAILRPKPETVDARYLGHALRSPVVLDDALKRKTGSAIRRIILSDLKRVRVPLPPLTQQRRIAAILDQAEALRAKRREGLHRLETLVQVIFMEFFRDPTSRGWPEKSIESIATRIRTGPFGSQLLHSEFVESGIAVLGIDNAVRNEFVWARPRFVTERKFHQLRRYQVSPGDVLVTIMGTCGRCAIVPNDVPTAINTKHLCCITLDRTQCLPTYLHECFLRHPSVLHRLGVRKRGAVMPGLNMQVIKDLVVPLPPVPVQRELETRIAVIEKLKETQGASLAKLDALFASLQHRAFRGEL